MISICVSSEWRPEDGKRYGEIEVRMNPDFRNTRSAMLGIVEVRDLRYTTTFDLLRIVGAPKWDPSFDLMNWDREKGTRSEHPNNVNGGMGGATALAGLYVENAKLRIRRLEVVGVPGCGLRYEGGCKTLEVEAGYFTRTGWPIYGSQFSAPGARFGCITARDNWWSDKWGQAAQVRAQALRGLEPQGISARGETAICGYDYAIDGYTMAGDGSGLKVCGSQFRVRGYHGPRCYVAGAYPTNKVSPLYADKKRFLHMHEARGIEFSESYLCAHGAAQSNRLLTVSGLFDEPAIFRGVVFRRTTEPVAIQHNLGGWARYEDCDFIGWGTDPMAAFDKLHADWTDPSTGHLYPAARVELVGCRGHAS